MMDDYSDDLDHTDMHEVYDDGVWAVSACLYCPSGNFVEWQVFRWIKHDHKPSGRWVMVDAGGEPDEWTANVPEAARLATLRHPIHEARGQRS